MPNEGENGLRAKRDLPQKVCVICRRPFTWRKKWQRCWDEVKYCSDRCRGRRVNSNSITTE
ncbi:DUF2256 domain-containing protein [Vibrio taketomensis]|uniref:DUF2256 domain-containing protein n=1 Tax=Vibrio taketomensis TaxID=2572923 RepID=UPI00138A4583|nr:DUF2256 domain-containing protein [Vibrio taketomensis]